MRMAAFVHVEKLAEQYGLLPYSELRNGFQFEGERIHLLERVGGIFKPKEMKYLLSIKTVIYKRGQKVTYEDQIDAYNYISKDDTYRGIFKSNETINYKFMGKDPDARENQLLREVHENEIPIIHFFRITRQPSKYLAVIPAYITAWNHDTHTASVAFGMPGTNKYSAPSSTEGRSYGFQTVRRRLHQAKFREEVVAAYGQRCAISGLPVQRLLDAAHIIPDQNDRLGQPVVRNGLLLAKTHHAAFDAHMIGIDPDCQLHVSEQLLAQHDGPMLEMLKQLRGEKLRLPHYKKDRPDPIRLEKRFAEFKAAEESPTAE